MAVQTWGLVGVLAWLATATLAHGAPAAPDPRQVNLGPPAAWILPVPTVPADPGPVDGDPALRMVYSDTQSFAGPDGQETYEGLRFKVLKPEALSVGNLAFGWSPAGGALTLHWLRVIHNGQVTDLTHDAKFRVVEREPGLEQAMFDGRLTATYQVPGLAVGDELEYAVTIRYRDPSLPEMRGDFLVGPQVAMPGTARLRLVWPTATPLKWQAGKDLGPIKVTTTGANSEIGVSFVKSGPPEDAALGAPARFAIRRLLESTTFADWPAFSRRLYPLFDHAAQLDAGSPIKAEIATIAKASADPMARADAAMRLVEDRIRYVFVAFDSANLTPSSADATWQRRFGDCKAKTVLLIALLRGLGIAADPVVVNAGGIDGLPDRLPTVMLFNHVVVRASIGGRDWLIDPTRSGDRRITLLPAMPFRQGLPLTAAGSAPVALPTPPPPRPQFVQVIDLDSTAGVGPHAKVTLRNVYRGNGAAQIREGLAALSAADGERLLRKLFGESDSWIDVDTIKWHSDEANDALVIDVAGVADMDWETGTAGMRSYFLPGGGFSPPDRLRRPHGQDQSLPWVTNWPDYRCWVTILRLPRPDDTQQWSLASNPVDTTLGAVAYWRRSSLAGNTVRVIESKRTLKPEISADEAAALNAAIAGFDNNKSWVEQQHHYKGAARPADQPLPFSDQTDWSALDAPCAAPAR